MADSLGVSLIGICSSSSAMSPQRPSPTGGANPTVDSTENMDSSELGDHSDGELNYDTEADQAGHATGTRKKKKYRKGRRGGKRKGKKAKNQEGTALDGQDHNPTPEPSTDITSNYNKMIQSIYHVWVPVVPHYVVRVIASGDENRSLDTLSVNAKKHGVFATEDIGQGTRIISEPPLITLSGPGHQLKELMKAFRDLPKYEQDRVWRLDPSELCASQLLSAFSGMIEPIVRRTIQLFNKPKELLTEEEKTEFKSSNAPCTRALALVHVASRWHAGCYSLPNVPEQNQATTPKDNPTRGLFVDTACLRHSCVPNCYAHYNAAFDRMTVQTSRAIKKGEELTLSLINNVHYRSAEQRAKELKDRFGIQCKCDACNPKHPQFQEHEDSRIRAAGRVILTEEFLTQMEIAFSDETSKELCLTSDMRPTRQPSQEELDDTAEIVLDLIDDLRATGYEDMELVRWFNIVNDYLYSQLANQMSDGERMELWEEMQTHAKASDFLTTRCLGEDTIYCKMMEQKKAQIDKVISDAEEAHAKRVG